MTTYKDAGVDVEAGYKAVRLMKNDVRRTFRPEVVTDIGGFGGLFALTGQVFRACACIRLMASVQNLNRFFNGQA